MTESVIEPPPPLIMFSTGQYEVSSRKQTIIKTRCGDPDAEDTFFKVWSGRPLETDVLKKKEKEKGKEKED